MQNPPGTPRGAIVKFPCIPDSGVHQRRLFQTKRSQSCSKGGNAKFLDQALELPGSSPSSATATATTPWPAGYLGLLQLPSRPGPPWLGPSKDRSFVPAELKPHLTLLCLKTFVLRSFKFWQPELQALGLPQGTQHGKIYS